MSALILRASGVLSNPLPGTPVIPDIETDLYFDFRASDLVGTVADGASVTNWVGRGPAPEVNRTLSTVLSGWTAPVFDINGGPGGTPTVSFNGIHSLRTVVASPAPFSGPFSVALVCSGTTQAASAAQNRSRIFSGTTPNPFGIFPNHNGELQLSPPGSGGPVRPNPGGHFAIVTVFNGANSLWAAGDGEAEPATISTFTGFDGFGLGSNINPYADGVFGLKGTVTRVIMYRRALSASDVNGLMEQLRDEHGV